MWHYVQLQVARASGKLAKGGEADINTAARMVLLDWQRGKLPFFSLPPDYVPEAARQQVRQLAAAARQCMHRETRQGELLAAEGKHTSIVVIDQ